MAVSYTHLDVYKRQGLHYIEISYHNWYYQYDQLIAIRLYVTLMNYIAVRFTIFAFDEIIIII